MATSRKISSLLTWLLFTEAISCLPQPVSNPVTGVATSEPNPSLRTQYPPSNQRIAVQTATPTYRVALDLRGHSSQLPFPTLDLSDLLGGLDGLLSPQTTASPTAPYHGGTSSGESSETDGDPSGSDDSSSDPDDSPSESEGSPSEATAFETATHTTATLTTDPSTADTQSTITSLPTMGQNIFEPIGTGAIPASIKTRNDHPIQNQHANSTAPIETNKFYAGLFLGSQTNASFTQPYSLAWSKGGGTLKSWGMAVSHVENNLLAYGPQNSKLPGSPVSYYINPIGLQHVILSATELNESTVLVTKEPKAFSAQAVLKRSAGSSQSITFPIVQGMGYVTGVYRNLQPQVQSGTFFRKIVDAGSPKPGIFKHQIYLEDGTTWVLYATPDNGAKPQFNLTTNTSLNGPAGYSGTIQVAKNPAGQLGEKFFDNSAGVYPVAGTVSGEVSGTSGAYSLSWTKAGKDVDQTPLIMFALPHHIQSFDNDTRGRATDVQLRTTTKGNATVVIGDHWIMRESNLPTDMGFSPWSPLTGNIAALSASAQRTILQVAPLELQQSIENETNLNSMYYSGKALSKFATLIWTVSELANSPNSTHAALQELKRCFARFVQNQQQFPLAYDSVWKGVVSTAGYEGDLNADFGNTAYNDHHFHYGYFIQAAAIVGTLDPSWLADNKEWVNTLVRDAGNSIDHDAFFPFSRSFDWFNGHSWAKGLFESFDGKDQESTSEDAMFAYAVKMWGKTIGDASMEARGNLMLAILRRSLRSYFLMQSNNTNQPANFIANKVTGILFENKVDHTTYFGNNLEFVQGIHMLPLLPNSGYTRDPTFVAEEWQAIFEETASTPASKVEGGWKGVLFANLALSNPRASWDFFAQSNFDYSWIDGGASRVWYLAYAAGLGGSP
ncbi:Endo-1,3(4)-beta-glucanase [Penicillium ucsense]|uniref:glucan endo-1,3-beta-D-glucosidase n=1 Tax=Penicillium ucsense TaxID=2839758 RepID=A0A8J8WMD8_9EURO|nr:Endo-1,3(4)-beta-glucanase [Penicillium ucsense]KAF7736098.1 Endo-1,3(4)-beta-glucanase [Penicillium ucsense]